MKVSALMFVCAGLPCMILARERDVDSSVVASGSGDVSSVQSYGNRKFNKYMNDIFDLWLQEFVANEEYTAIPFNKQVIRQRKLRFKKAVVTSDILTVSDFVQTLYNIVYKHKSLINNPEHFLAHLQQVLDNLRIDNRGNEMIGSPFFHRNPKDKINSTSVFSLLSKFSSGNRTVQLLNSLQQSRRQMNLGSIFTGYENEKNAIRQLCQYVSTLKNTESQSRYLRSMSDCTVLKIEENLERMIHEASDISPAFTEKAFIPEHIKNAENILNNALEQKYSSLSLQNLQHISILQNQPSMKLADFANLSVAQQILVNEIMPLKMHAPMAVQFQTAALAFSKAARISILSNLPQNRGNSEMMVEFASTCLHNARVAAGHS